MAILLDIVCRENMKLKILLKEANEKNAEQRSEMEKRDESRLRSQVGVMGKRSYKEQVRVLNTCQCCPRHMERKIKPEDFDKEEVVRFPQTNRTLEEWEVEIAKCWCTCRQKTRLLYREYRQTCIQCNED